MRRRSWTAPARGRCSATSRCRWSWPFIMVAAVIRLIDALKTFDTIYVITLGGPGTSSETMNILLYQTAFAYYDLGYGSAIVVVFFVLILLISLLLLRVRQREALAMRRAIALRRLARPRRAVCLGHPAGVAGGAVLPVDAVAVAEERAGQHRLSAGVHPESADAGELRRCVREERLPDLHDQLGDRVVLGDRAGAAVRRAGGLRHRQGEGHQGGGADPDRARDAWPVLSDPAVPAVPVARHDRHADAAGDHPSGDHRADRRLGHDRLLRGPAGRTGGSRAGRWRDDLAGLPCTSRCRWRGRASRWR